MTPATRTSESMQPQRPDRANPPPVISSASAAGHERGQPRERRNDVLRQELLSRIKTEYVEMPGLVLTIPQAQRLFGLREDICSRVFDTLVDAGVLRRDANGAFGLDLARP